MSAFRYEEQLPNAIYGHTKYVIRADGGAEKPVAVCYDERTAEIICAALATGANPVAETGALEPDGIGESLLETMAKICESMARASDRKAGLPNQAAYITNGDIAEATRWRMIAQIVRDRHAPSGEPEEGV